MRLFIEYEQVARKTSDGIEDVSYEDVRIEGKFDCLRQQTVDEPYISRSAIRREGGWLGLFTHETVTVQFGDARLKFNAKTIDREFRCSIEPLYATRKEAEEQEGIPNQSYKVGSTFYFVWDHRTLYRVRVKLA